jgi:hypothetical protein
MPSPSLADIAFSSKIGCEAAGYLLTFGLVNVLNPKWMIVVLFTLSVPAMIMYLAFWHAPERPVATLFGEPELSLTDDRDNSSVLSDDQEAGLRQLQAEEQNVVYKYVDGEKIIADPGFAKSESGDNSPTNGDKVPRASAYV